MGIMVRSYLFILFFLAFRGVGVDMTTIVKFLGENYQIVYE